MTDTIELLGKPIFEKLIFLLMYGKDPHEKATEEYEEKIKNSFEKVYADLEKIYGKINKEDNRFFDLIADFAEIHDDVYFEIGFYTGIKLVKCLESVCGKGVSFHPKTLFDSGNKKENSYLEESVLRQFIEVRMGTALEEALRQEATSQKQSLKNGEATKEIDTRAFTQEQWDVIDMVLAEHNDNAAEYGKMAYRQGALDLFCLFKELLIQN